MFGEMIRCWREGWGENLPFLFVQLAPFGYFALSNGNSFIPIRAMQERVSKTVQNTYMACIMDAGMEYDIHPKLKRPVGVRLALLALGKVYGRDILCESPGAISITKEPGRISVLFVNAGAGLRIYGDKVNSLELLINGVPVEYFEVEVCGSELNVRCPLITNEASAELRLAWVGYCEVNLYSSAGLPAKPFVLKASGYSD
jgi:sialate O-acetylesterase